MLRRRRVILVDVLHDLSQIVLINPVAADRALAEMVVGILSGAVIVDDLATVGLHAASSRIASQPPAVIDMLCGLGPSILIHSALAAQRTT